MDEFGRDWNDLNWGGKRTSLSISITRYKDQRFAKDIVEQADNRTAAVIHCWDFVRLYPIRFASFPLRRQTADTWEEVSSFYIASIVMSVKAGIAPQIKISVSG